MVDDRSDGIDEERLKEFEETMDAISAKDMLLGMVATLVSLAFKKLGVPDETKQDLVQASLVIDSLDALVAILQKELPADEASTLQQTVSSLQLTYSSMKMGPSVTDA